METGSDFQVKEGGKGGGLLYSSEGDWRAYLGFLQLNWPIRRVPCLSGASLL